jgi:hypothetical protein
LFKLALHPPYFDHILHLSAIFELPHPNLKEEEEYLPVASVNYRYVKHLPRACSFRSQRRLAKLSPKSAKKIAKIYQ